MASIPRPGTTLEPKPWQTGLAPVYIGMFLWVAFFDQLGRRALPVGGLGWSLLGVAVAGPIGYLLLYRIPAVWGKQTGQGLAGVSESTFGVQGSTLVPGLLLGLGQVVVFAVAVGYAVDLTFQGLAIGRFLDPRAIRPVSFGGAPVKPPLVLATTLFWAVATALVSLRFVRWIAYLMQFFPIFPAILLGGSMLAMLGGLRDFDPSRIDPMTSALVPIRPGRWLAFQLTFQWVLAFGAIAGLLGADWGSGSLTLRDVKLGGWLGMGFAPVIVSSLALITVAGHQGTIEAQKTTDPTPFARSTITELVGSAGVTSDAPASTFRAVLATGFDRRIACVMFLVFGLASLAPACYAAFVFGERFAAIGPGISRFGWSMMGTATAWLLIVGGWADRTETVFNTLGAVFAPAVGAMAADYRRQKGRWPGPRRGMNPAGLIAWLVGSAVGLAPTVSRSLGFDFLVWLQPSTLAGFVAAFLTYEILGRIGLESGPAPAPATGRPQA